MTEIQYDDIADAAYVTLGEEIKPGEATMQVDVALPDGVGGQVILDFDESGHLLGIEIIGAKALLRP